MALGFDEDGDTITSATVTFTPPEQIPVAKPTPAETVVLEAVRALLSEGAETVSAQDVADAMSVGTGKTSQGVVRKHLASLTSKGLLKAPVRGKWAIIAPESGISTLCITPLDEGAKLRPEIQNGTQSGMGIFA